MGYLAREFSNMILSQISQSQNILIQKSRSQRDMPWMSRKIGSITSIDHLMKPTKKCNYHPKETITIDQLLSLIITLLMCLALEEIIINQTERKSRKISPKKLDMKINRNNISFLMENLEWMIICMIIMLESPPSKPEKDRCQPTIVEATIIPVCH